MKKIAVATVMALAMTTVSAFEIGVTASRDFSGNERDFGGITLGQSFGKFNVTLGAEKSTVGNDDQGRFSLVGGYDLITLGSVTLTSRLGVGYLANKVSRDGYVAMTGVEARVPLSNQFSFSLAVDRQYGQSQVEQFDGNRVTAGLKYRY
jgi:hypothetical protein